jgi:uncharacterized protein YqjF (DUF2071 family)
MCGKSPGLIRWSCASTRRIPPGRPRLSGPAPFLTAEWRDLVMLNYEVDPALLRPLVPDHTELDSWNRRTLISVVGFRFLDTRVRGLAIPGHREFEELNLRFYVRHKAGDGWRRGVAFVMELVPRRAIAWIARAAYNENYHAVPMRHEVTPEGGAPARARKAEYQWLHGGRWNSLVAEFDGVAEQPVRDSEEEFITEHYWGYTRQRDGGTVEYQVEHPRWAVWRAKAARLDCDMVSFYGPAYAPFLGAAPSSALVADGSRVTVRRGERI